MAVEKLKLVSIIGPINDFDRFIMQYIGGKNIHLENVYNVLSSISGLHSFKINNPYEEMMKNAADMLEYTGIKPEEAANGQSVMQAEEITEYVDALNSTLVSMTAKRKSIDDDIAENNLILQQLESIKNVDIRLEDLFDFKFVKVRFGKMPKDSFVQMDAYLKDYDAFFFKFSEDREYVYGLYLAPVKMRYTVDGIFSSLYFQRVRISEKADGTPMEVITQLSEENRLLGGRIDDINKEILSIVHKEYDKICSAYKCAKRLYDNYNVRRYAAKTKDSFYLAGWMPEADVPEFKRTLYYEQNITVLVEEPETVQGMTPPTKLRNNRLFKPFESFVTMYGLPAYNEMDPTMLFAITYSMMFGIMYGDVGHGLVLGIVGLFMSKKKMFLGPILEICGIVSIFFGFLYGSVFGYEHLIPTLWYKPFENSDTMMTTLIMSVGLGAVLLTAAMLINMVNGIKQKNIGKILFSPNGVAGFVFYWAVIIGVLSMLRGKNIMTLWYIAIFVAIPLLAVFFKEPLTHLLQKRKNWMPANKGEFFLETFFELFELLLSYVTNTISFIRVGAFALNHAGMLAVVFALAGMTRGLGNIAAVIIGNIIVLGLEGLLVAIQVLRLQFYELFSRYYDGSGRPFKKFSENR